MAADFSGSANQQYAHRPAYATTGAMTAVVITELDALANYTALFYKQGSTTTDAPYEISVSSVGVGSSNGRITFLRANTNYHIWSHSTDIVSAAANTRQTLIFRTNGQARLEDAPTVIVNGVKTTLDTEFNTGATGAVTDNGAAVWIGRRYDGATQLDGRIYYVALFNRAISDAEALSLTQNPWQLFAKRPKRVFVTAAAGGSYSLTCSAGSYLLTGQSVGLLASRSLAVAQGSYTLTGQDVALLRLYTLTAAQGSYSLSGQAVALTVSRLLAAGQGSYALTGQAVGMFASRVLAAGQGSYALTGQAVGLVYTPLGSYSLISDAGSYSLTGKAVGLPASRVLAAEAGSYGLSGQDVGLVYTPAGASYTLTAEAGSYAITGQDISFARTYVLAASAGSYTLTGRDVTLSYSGAPPVSVPDMVRTARGVARLAIHGTTRNVIRGYRP